MFTLAVCNGLRSGSHHTGILLIVFDKELSNLLLQCLFTYWRKVTLSAT